MENPYLNKMIDSPRSIRSMNILGRIMDDIYYLTFPEFIENFQEFRRFSPDIQKKMYEFYEDYRIAKIKVINEVRENQIKNNIDINDNINNVQNIPQMPTFSTTINKELLKFEQMQRKNMMDMMKAVELELERMVLMKEEESKIRKTNMKKDEFQKELEIKHCLERKELEDREKRKILQEKERLQKLAEENKKKI